MYIYDILSLKLIIIFILTDSLNSWNKNLDNYKDVYIYIDVIAMLLIGNIKNTKEEKFYKEEMNILRAIAHALPEFFKYFRVRIIYFSRMRI